MAEHQERHERKVEVRVPEVQELSLVVPPVTDSTPVLDILSQFQNDSELLALPIINGSEEYVGTLSRRTFLNYMTRTFTKELFSRKPLAALVKLAPQLADAPIMAEAHQRVDEVMRELLLNDPDMHYEAVPVADEHGIVGVASVSDMMLSLSESQGKLLSAIQTMTDQLKEEVSFAGALQRQLLRPSEIQMPGIRGVATLMTSTEVGGDFYDYYLVDGRYAVLIVGDVSGHGVGAGTLVSAAKAGVNLLEASRVYDPAEILTRLNTSIINTARQALLMTMIAAVLDTRTGELRLANAGHQFPYIFRAVLGQWEVVEIGGLPLGKSEEASFASETTELDVGDRLFFFTDGIVEEENAEKDMFGYDRLESILTNMEEEPVEILRNALLGALMDHVGSDQYEDDVTIFIVEHTERTIGAQSSESTDQSLQIIRIAEDFYRENEEPVSNRISRQNMVFIATNQVRDLILRLAADGIRRILFKDDQILERVGWDHALAQHLDSANLDLFNLLTRPQLQQEYNFTHSDDKMFIMQEAQAWLEETQVVPIDTVDAVVLLLDELIENGLYAAPRDGKDQQLYAKGTERELMEGEHLSLYIAIEDGILGITLVDTWGTLTPRTFLTRLTKHAQGVGLESGVGGAGLFLVWKMSDYLQIRVHPHLSTQVTLLINLEHEINPDYDKSFQFLYHSEVHEAVNYEQSIVADQPAAIN